MSYTFPPDPYTATAEAIWRLLLLDTDFAAAVPSGNRISFLTDARAPEKEYRTTADFPQVRLIIASSAPQIPVSSCSMADFVTWELQVESGDQRFDAYHFPLRWLVFKALANAQPYLLREVQFGTPLERICRNVSVPSIADPAAVTGGEKEQRRHIGWTGLYALQTDLYFALPRGL